MDVSGINTNNKTSNTTNTTNAAVKTGLDYNAFLQLLVAEMKNQDPLEPVDSSQYVAQFATFSNVEQAIKSNTKLDSILTVSALTQANSIIGRTATSGDGTISGVVKAVRVADGEAQAILASGQILPLSSGTVIE
ncbi:flagellar hook assembly protein FlgD [Mangrovicella endophytica]|uniref:flagellar hook assembly protein FlgD n=1 Tax=Mangrovicella endophytica TaxID=2066697 RepID=UPI000C9EC1DF|nr:flagellar hook assembly protein FlgD [Mangrovicella endophytica]